MKKITTLSELAKVCGCSPATVSYVLNGREDQRISEETKQKILQMANLFQYRINPYAKALAKGEVHNIMFFYAYSDFSLAKSDTLNFINELSFFLKENQFNVIIAPTDQIQKFEFVDAVITYRISKKAFKELSNKNYVPVIAIDTMLHDDLFYEIVNSFDELISDASTVYISTPYDDSEINEELKAKAHIEFVESFTDLKQSILKHSGKRMITFNIEIQKYLKCFQLDIEYHSLNPKEKYEAILEAIQDSIARNEDKNHQIRVKS